MSLPDMPKGDSDVGLFVTVKDGESVTGVLNVEKRHFFFTHWVNNKSELCTGEGCVHCKADVKRRSNFRMPFYTKVGDKWVCQILEKGPKFYESLQLLSNNGYDLTKTPVKIIRRGKGLETSWNVLPDLNAKFDPAWVKDVNVPELEWKVEGLEATPSYDPPIEEVPF